MLRYRRGARINMNDRQKRLLRENLEAQGREWRHWIYANADGRVSGYNEFLDVLSSMNEDFWDRYTDAN